MAKRSHEEYCQDLIAGMRKSKQVDYTKLPLMNLFRLGLSTYHMAQFLGIPESAAYHRLQTERNLDGRKSESSPVDWEFRKGS